MLTFSLFSIAINFETKLSFKIHPLFLFRSVIGMQLHNTVCLFKKRKCIDCSINRECAYAMIFETIIDKDNSVLPKNEKSLHPFVLYSEADENVKTEKINLYVTIIGKAISYFPYFYYALVKAGKYGIQKERIKFEVNDVSVDGKSIIEDKDNVKMPEEFKKFELLSDTETFEEKSIKVELKTPFRFKKDGKYLSDFEANDFFESIYRRLFVLNSLYGEGNFPEWKENKTISIKEKNLFWKDLKHYSARQKDLLKLGGVVGSFILEGKFTPFDISLLKGAEVFNVGKNVAFGLGKVMLIEK